MWPVVHRINQSIHFFSWFWLYQLGWFWGTFFLSRIFLSRCTFLRVFPNADRRQPVLPWFSLPFRCSYRPNGKITRLVLDLSRDLEFIPDFLSNFQWNPGQWLFFFLSINFLVCIIKGRLYPLYPCHCSSWIQRPASFWKILRSEGKSFTLLFILSVISLIIYCFFSCNQNVWLVPRCYQEADK